MCSSHGSKSDRDIEVFAYPVDAQGRVLVLIKDCLLEEEARDVNLSLLLLAQKHQKLTEKERINH